MNATEVPTRRELCEMLAMRLTFKLSLAIGLCILGVLSAHATLRIANDVKVFRSDVRQSHEVLGRVLSTGVELLLERNDMQRALELVSAVNAREGNVRIRWLHQGDDALVPDVWLNSSEMLFYIVPQEGIDAVVTYTPVVRPDGARSFIEMVEPLTWERERVQATILRTLTTTLVLLGACLVALWIFGVLLVGRPIGLLRDHLRRVGDGDLVGRVALRSHDEIGDLAREVNAMTQNLADAYARAEEQSAARAETLERLRHADRLRAVGEMASAVAHEVGTPLAIVRGRGQQLETTEVSAERVKEIAALIVGEVDRMAQIIRQLLAFARLDASDVRPWPIAPWATETAALVEPLARAAGVRVAVVLPSEGEAPESVEFDSGKLRQVAINLLMNAIHASPRGEVVTLTVSVEDTSLVLRVEDTGAGVPESLRADIFEPFFTTKTAGEGTGLGLSVAAGIVRDQGGLIRVVPRPQGACFEARIPTRRD